MPILLFFMNGVNLIGVVLNLLIVPLVPLVTIYGFTCLLLYALFAWSGWIFPEMLLMQGIFALAGFGAKWGIFLVAKNLFAKYLLVAIFLLLGIMSYRKRYT